MIIFRDCNIEIDIRSGCPEHELITHYDELHINLIERYMKCMQRQYSCHNFKNEGKHVAREVIGSKRSYID